MKNGRPQACKRSACDRCREQKLRCSRSTPGDSACDRCLRLNASCVRGNSRPLGRPSLRANDHGLKDSRPQWPSSQDLRHDGSQLNDCLQHSWPQLTQTNTEFAMSLCGCPSSNIAPDNAAASAIEQADPLASSLNVDYPGLSDGHLGASEFSNAVSETGSSVFDALDAEHLGFHFRDSPEMMVDLDLCDLTEDPQEATAESTGASVHSISAAVQNDAHTSVAAGMPIASAVASCNGDTIAFLLVTVADMSHKLAELDNEHDDSWDSCDISIVNDELFSGRQASGQGPLTSHSPLKQVLDVSTRFVWALQAMKPAASVRRSHSGTLAPLPVTLVILSTFIQLVQLLNRLLACVVNVTLEGIEKPQEQSANSSRPGTSRGEKSHQQTIMVTRIIEHQLHALEQSIGVPGEYRLWSPVDSEAGILGHDQSSDVTRAIMDQAQESSRSLKQKMDRIAFGA